MKLINEKNTRRLLLEHAAQTRAHKFTRVSKSTLTYLNERYRMVVLAHVASLPSKGKTI